MSAPQDTSPPARSPYVIALVVTLATFMEVLDTTIANVALPHIAGALSASISESTWVLTSYLVANAIVLPLSGWLSSIMGRKRFYMTAVALFTVNSLLCGFAPNLTWLIVFRVLQGLGGGGLQPTEQAILYDTFPPAKRGMGMAIYGVAVVTAPIIGPTLGGWLTDNLSWRWIFFVNIPVGCLSLLLTSRVIHDPPGRGKRDMTGFKMDYIGLALIGLGLGSLQIVLDRGQQEGWLDSNLICGLALIGAVALVAMVIWSLRHKDPLIDLRLLGDRNFFFSNITMFLLGFALFGSTVLLPVLLQTLLGYTATDAGMVLSPGGIITMICMPIVGALLSRFEGRWLVVLGVAACSYSLYLMSRFTLTIDYWTATNARLIQGFGLAFLFVPINTMAFYFVPRERANYATGLLNLARNLGGSCGIAFVATMLQRRAQVHQNFLVAHLTPYDPGYRDALNGLTQRAHEHGASLADAAQQAQGVAYNLVQQQASLLAFLDNFRILGLSFLIVIPMMFLMKRTIPGRGTGVH